MFISPSITLYSLLLVMMMSCMKVSRSFLRSNAALSTQMSPRFRSSLVLHHSKSRSTTLLKASLEENISAISRGFFTSSMRSSSDKLDSSSPATAVTPAASAKPPVKEGGIKELWNKYGWVAVGTYLSIYVTTLSSLFMALNFDVFNASTFGFEPTEAVKKVCDLVENVTGYAALPAYIRENPKVGTLAVAWVMTKFTEPIRLGITLVIVPGVNSSLIKLGLKKPKEGEAENDKVSN